MLKNFGISIYQSISNPSWLKAQRFFLGKAFKYFFSFLLAAAFITAVPFAVQFPGALGSLRSAVVNDVPDFSAKLQNGKLSVSNLSQPYVYRSDSRKFVVTVDTASNAVTSTSSSAVTSTPFASDAAVPAGYSSIAVTADQISINNVLTGDSRVENWSDVPDFAFAKSDAVSFLDRVSSPGVIALIILAGFIIIYAGLIISQIYAILVVSLVVWVAARLMRRDWTLFGVMVMGLRAITLPTIITIVTAFLGLPTSSIFFLALLAFMLAVVIAKDKAEETQEPLDL